QAAPYRVVGDERRPQLVTEAKRGSQYAVAPALQQVATGGLPEAGGAFAGAAQLAKAVVVLAAQLVRRQLIEELGRQCVFFHVGDRDDRRRVERQQAETVEIERLEDDPGNTVGESLDVALA